MAGMYSNQGQITLNTTACSRSCQFVYVYKDEVF